MAVTEVENKIRALFELRNIYTMLEEAISNQKELQEGIRNLHRVQEAIYHLDQYLEETNDPVSQELDALWANITRSLEYCNIPMEMHASYCSEIRMYQDHELLLREGNSLISMDPFHFYIIKSCDVKLMRKLLYFWYPVLIKSCKESDWILFDFYAEMYDDLDDIFEDMETNNGNYFLSVVSIVGLEEACCMYSNWIEEAPLKLMATKLNDSKFIEEITYKMKESLLELIGTRRQLMEKRSFPLGNPGQRLNYK
ncbi:MAG TPA: hypothetical protein PKC30_09565 [Saprospiraceae bacterium]|nr:hypothetical protein [Saprospiraceae bacterium]